MATIEITDISKRFAAVTAVDGATLSVASGEFVALLGPSGCGKTTLLRTIAGFEVPDAGEVRLGGRSVTDPWVPPERRRVGMVFQDYALFPHLSVLGNVGFALPRKGAEDRVREVLDMVGLDSVQDRYPHELSGGQQQRVALARALAGRPDIVLLDEPWSSIDPVTRGHVRGEMAEVLRASGTTVLLVTHDQEEALGLADRVALMRDGRVVQAATPEELYRGPVDRWSAEFVGTANFVPGRASGGRVATALGDFPGNGHDGDCSVLVRPELVCLEPSEAGEAVIVNREFRGHDVLYRVALTDGTALWSQRPSNEIVALGQRVRVSLHDGPVSVF